MRWLGTAAALGALLAVAAAAVPAGAVTPRTFTVATQKEFLEGEAQGLRLDASGEVTLAPRFPMLAALDEPLVWAVAPAGDGGVWVGTGSSGRLLQVTAAGAVSEQAHFDEPQVTALLSDGDGVLAATSPSGAVYRVVAGKAATVVARPVGSYIWALARAGGKLYAATGIEGIVYEIGEGEARPFFRAPDLQVVSLVAGADGSLVAGTYERGLVLSLDRAGHAAVLYDSALREARALLVAPDGSIYAAINGGATFQGQGAGQTRTDGSITVTVEDGSAGAPAPPPPPPLTLPAPDAAVEMTSEVVRIAPGRAPEIVARTRGEVIYALAWSAGGELLAATSKRILVPASGEEVSVVTLNVSGGAGQVSALRGSAGALFLATTAPSKVYAAGSGAEASGTYTSKVFAAEGEARFGAIRIDADVPAGARLELETRSGGTLEPDATWSAWSPVAPGGTAPLQVPSPPGRFVQWRARFAAAAGTGLSPRLRSLTLAWQARNLRPAIKSFAVQPPGVLFQKSAPVQGVVETAPPPLPSMFEELGAAKAEPAAAGKRLYRRGALTFTWEVSDPNEDELWVKLSVRRRDGGPWLGVRERPESNLFTFDSEVLPDGWYVARLVADDAPSNPGDPLTQSRDAGPFLVDNTPPRLRVGAHSLDGGRARVRFEAEDDLSALWRAEWSLDGGAFVPVFPTDGITDGASEAFEIETGALAPGEHVVVLRVADLANQSASAHAVFEVK